MELVKQIRQDLLDMFSDLRFDESRHLYYVNGENYPSVSKKLEAHYEKFNKEFYLPLSAKKASREEGRWVSENELEKRWDNKNHVACAMGHDTHSFLELYKPGDEALANIPQKVAGVKFLRDYVYCENPRYIILHQEFRMIHRKHKYCGTTDMILWDTVEEAIVILDWKTNEDLFKTYGYLKYPFDQYQSNPFNKYQLQFNYYQLMLEQSKYRVSERWLIYLDGEKNYTKYNVEDLTKTLNNYLDNPEVIKSVPATYGLVW